MTGSSLCHDILIQLVSLDTEAADACEVERELLSQLAMATGQLLVEHDTLMKRCQYLSLEHSEMDEKISYLQNYINMREEPMCVCKKPRTDH